MMKLENLHSGNDLRTTLLGAAQKMDQLLSTLSKKEYQLIKIRTAKDSESTAKSLELEELARKIPGFDYFSFLQVQY
jgi:hypothetical protein